MQKVLVACLGNIFYGDDAFGVEVAKEVSKKALPENVKVVDFGIRGIDLAFELSDDYELVILVDTIQIGAEVGSVFVLEPKLNSHNEKNLSHDLTPKKALQFAQNLKASPEKMLLVACEPVSLEFNHEMSEEVKNAVHIAVNKVLELLENVENQ